MPDSIPQWILDNESDYNIYRKKQTKCLILLLIDIIIVSSLIIYFESYKTYITILYVLTLIPILFVFLGNKKPSLPTQLAANLYRIGAELEAFDPTSPSYIKRNQNYLKNCQKIINNLIIEDDYFIQDYIKFLKNLENTVLRLNHFYSTNSRPNNVNVSGDLKSLSVSIHDDAKNLKPEQSAYVEGILSNLGNAEPLALDKSLINKLYDSLNTRWYNISYSYRATATFLVIGIIISAALSIVMIYALNMEKSESIGYALVGTLTLLGGLVTQLDKIVPRERIKFS